MFKRLNLTDQEKWEVSWSLYIPKSKLPLVVLDKRRDLKNHRDYYVIWNPRLAGISGAGCYHMPTR